MSEELRNETNGESVKCRALTSINPAEPKTCRSERGVSSREARRTTVCSKSKTALPTSQLNKDRVYLGLTSAEDSGLIVTPRIVALRGAELVN
jgi:hypothetical protein